MPIHDLRRIEPGQDLQADICVVGSGPAGLTIASQFVGSNTRVCIVESGGETVDSRTDDLDAIESVGLRRAPQRLVRSRLLGGTSHLWSGRCGLLDSIDYLARPWLRLSGWPIDHDALVPYVDRASRVLRIGPDLHSMRAHMLWHASLDRPGWDASKFLPAVWQFSKQDLNDNAPIRHFVEKGPEGAETIGILQHGGAIKPVHFGEAYLSDLQRSQNIQVVLNATAVAVEINEGGSRIKSVVIRSLDGGQRRVHAEAVVLACGAIENARLLLASKAVNPNGVGNANDQVGRYLTDHAVVPIGLYQGEGSKALRYRLGNRWFNHRGQRFVYNIGLRLSPSVQQHEQLLNCSLHLYEFGSEPSTLSSAANALRRLKSGKLDGETLAHARAATKHPMDLAHGAYLRYAFNRPALGWATEVGLGCVVEQQLDPDSRITLSDERDRLGMNRARVDWRSGELEHQTARRMAELFYSDMVRLGMALPTREAWLDGGISAYRERLLDAAHPMCTTRMSSDPKKGVVDANCAVHGVDGLYVAGSSVFATPSHMNPTMMIVALGLRIADHLKDKMANHTSKGVTSAGPIIRTSTGSERPIRVGLIGVGHRVQSQYLPVLRSLGSSFTIAGVASRTQASAEQTAKEIGCGAYRDAGALVGEAKADFLIVAVSPDGIDDFLPSLTGIPVPILLETPFAWNVRRGRKTLQKFKKNGMVVGVAEQFPFLPAEQLKRKLIDLGMLGRVVRVYNDHAVFDYHGIATLRSYLSWDQKPLHISATSTLVPRSNPRGGDAVDALDTWMHGTVTFGEGTVLIHHYSPDYADSPVREPKTLRVYGTKGSLVGEGMTLLQPDGNLFTANFRRDIQDNRLQSISVDTPSGEVNWSNPFSAHSFSEEQIGIAVHLMQMRNVVLHNGEPVYAAERALEDSEILTAMSYSAAGRGRPLGWPLKAQTERIKSKVRGLARKLRRG